MNHSRRPLLDPVGNPGNNGVFPITSEPSAPALQHLVEDEAKKKKKWIRKIFWYLSGQLTIFAVICCLFVYIPHLRKVFREDVFDKIFLSSIIGTPLIIFMLLLGIFPSWRKRLAYPALIIITTSLAFLLSYTMTRANASSMMMAVLVSDASSIAMLGSSFVPNLNVANRAGMSIPPLLTLCGNLVYPSLVKNTSYSSAIIPIFITTGLMCHLSVNCARLLGDESFDEISSASSEYAFTQVYMKLGIYDIAKDLIRRRRDSSYRSISE